MSKFLLLRIIPLLACLILSLSRSLAAPVILTDKDRGIQEYNAGNYSEAYESFWLSISLWPEDAETHYYLANCLAHLNRLGEAVQEYENALGLAKDKKPALASYCSAGMANCKLAMSSRAKAASKPSREVKKEIDVATAVQKIKDEAELQKTIFVKTADSMAQNRLAAGQSKVKSIESERDYRIDYMRHAGLTDRWGHFYPFYTQGDIDNTYHSYEQSLLDAASTASDSAELVRVHGRWATKELDNTAASLEDRLKDPNSGHGPKLLPLGTNLYVRNYSLLGTPSSNSTEQPELTATQEKLILDRHQRFIWPNRTGAQPNDSSRTTTADVYGRLLENK